MNPNTESNIKQLLAFIVGIVLICGGIYFLLKYFYPADTTEYTPTVRPEAPVSEDTSSENPVRSTLNFKNNITQTDIQNTVYSVWGNLEAKFIEGKYHRGLSEPRSDDFAEGTITTFAFGDLNGDGSGDAVVVTSTSVGNSPLLELHIVLNIDGLARTMPIKVPLEEGYEVRDYETVFVSEGKIMLRMKVLAPEDARCCPSIEKTENYILKDKQLFVDAKKALWKTYKNNEFKFAFSYPEKSELEVRAINNGTRDIIGTIRASVTLPFVSTYNTWNKKSATIYVQKGACPYRNASTQVEQNGLQFHVYDPAHTETSNTETVLKMKELMTYRAPFCYTILSKIEGPGPKSASFPKATELRAPENIETFLKFESLIIEQVIEAFKLL